MNTSQATREVDANFTYFETKLPKLKKDHLKEFALLHKQQIIDFFKDEDDAIQIGFKDYGEGRFSVQQVADNRIDLGYQSYGFI